MEIYSHGQGIIDCAYLTEGKRYTALSEEGYQDCFSIKDDWGRCRVVKVSGCAHLQGNLWAVVETEGGAV